MIKSIWSFVPEIRKAAFRSGRFALDRDSVQAQGLIGWWPLGMQDGADKSLYGNHGARTSGLLRTSSLHPILGGITAAECDGSAEAVEFGDLELFDFDASTSWTITYEGRLDALPSVQTTAVAKRRGSNTGWSLYVNNLGNVTVLLNSSATVSATAVSTVSAGQWYNGSAVCNRSSNLLYSGCNGVLGSSADISTVGSLATGWWFQIGSEYATGSPFKFRVWDGLLANVRIYLGDKTSILPDIYRNPTDIIYPLGIRTISFAPAAGGGGGLQKTSLALLGVGA